MKNASTLLFALFALGTFAGDNPPAEGFHTEASDEKAIELADQVMEALGGREAWDQARYLQWIFMGRRFHFWDRYTGDIRVEEPASKRIVLLNLNTREGRAVEGRKMLEGEALQEALTWAYESWVNDSYWLVMPYKMKDTGVTLKYLGSRQSDKGRPSEVVSMTFDAVGVTPQNKYHVWISPQRHLITRWDFFQNAEDEEPSMSTPWDDWVERNGILLSKDRGTLSLSNLGVWHEIDAEKRKKVLETVAPMPEVEPPPSE